MTDKKPTQEQRKEFWEWCGFYQELDRGSRNVWRYPSGAERILPEIDLPNLFQYAVPKLQNCVLSVSLNGGYICTTLLDGRWSGVSSNDDPALALFWAIWEVVKLPPPMV